MEGRTVCVCRLMIQKERTKTRQICRGFWVPLPLLPLCIKLQLVVDRTMRTREWESRFPFIATFYSQFDVLMDLKVEPMHLYT